MIDELEQLRHARDGVAPPSEAARLAAATALAAAIAAPSRGGAGAIRRSPLRRTRRAGHRIPLAASALAATVLAIVLTGTLRSGSPGSPATAAAAVLTHLAKVAAEQPATDAPGAGQYLYVKSQSAYANDTFPAGGRAYSVFVPQTREIWIGPDDSGWLRETDGQATFPSAADRAAWIADGSPALPTAGTSNTRFGAGCLSIGPPNMSSLPTDPAALGAEIAARHVEGGPPGPAEDFVQVGDLLRETDASPALRSALYTVASRIPGVISLGTVTDQAGRSGVGLGYDDQGTRQELIFDPKTSALLGETDVSSAGKVVGWAVYLETSIVGSLPSTAPDSRVEPVTAPPSRTTTSGNLPTPIAGSDAQPCQTVSG